MGPFNQTLCGKKRQGQNEPFLQMTFLAQMTRKAAANALLKSVLDAARSIKDTVHFLYYRISYGIAEILKYASVEIRDWFKPKRTDQNQLRFRLSA